MTMKNFSWQNNDITNKAIADYLIHQSKIEATMTFSLSELPHTGRLTPVYIRAETAAVTG